MRIIKNNKSDTVTVDYSDLIFASASEKKKDSYVKAMGDYIGNYARMVRKRNVETFGKNYKFYKGQLSPEDFYEVDSTIQSFVSDLEEGFEKTGEKLPAYVQNYTGMLQPVNTLIGEECKKPDNFFVKAYDADSQSEQLEFMTEQLTNYARSTIQNKILQKAVQQGVDVESEEFLQQAQQMTEKELAEKIDNYSSEAEKWGNRMLENLKMEFNLKEVKEETLADLLKAGRLYTEVYEDSSPLGFNVKVINPVDYFEMNMPNEKYAKKAYLAGYVEVLEISQIIEKFKLNKEEVDALVDKTKGKNSDNATYELYNSYDRGVEEYRRLEEERLFENDLSYQAGFTSNKYAHSYGSKFLCLSAYYKGKILVGKLDYFDEEGIPQTTEVDENYKKGDHPYEISFERYYFDQIYKLTKIGDVLYDITEVDYTDRLPIAGGKFDPKNSEVAAYIDYMKPIQVLINICGNQLYELLNKEEGVITVHDLRRIPVTKDGEIEDAIENYEEGIKRTGKAYEDNSPENRKVPGDNTSITRAIDASRTNEINSRIALWRELQNMMWAMVGITPARLGGSAASQTATGTQAELSSSYSQTEPWMAFHEYVINDLYQLLLDTAQYYESSKPFSTIPYMTDQGGSALMKVTGNSLSLRDMRVFVTSRTEDLQILNSAKQFSMEMLQNGVPAADVFKMQSQKSIRFIEHTLDKVKEMQDEYKQQQLQVEQQKTQAIQEQTQMNAQIEQAKIQNDNMNKQLDRESRENVALISASSSEVVDSDNNGLADVAEVWKNDREASKISNDAEIRKSQLAAQQQDSLLKNQAALAKMKAEQEKLRVTQDENAKDREIKLKELETAKYIANKNKN